MVGILALGCRLRRTPLPNMGGHQLRIDSSRNVSRKSDGQKWRTSCEGRISVAKRPHGLRRCRYNCYVGMHRCVGCGVIADNLLNIGRAIEKRAETIV
jgi:transposase, IS5 family